ncbi:DNA repair protein RECN [Corynebacterium renale]|nr:DNA repair protein RECN [Corynebacterium renale]
MRYNDAMLSEISIQNLGVIDRATAELSPGLTVLTGETGAGKTMVVTSLRLLTGGRAEASRVRTGADKAVVEGRFVVEGVDSDIAAKASEVVVEAGGDADENGDFVANRIINKTGRSRAHLGGRSVPAVTLEQFSRELLTIHGQNDQLRLLGADQQRAALDRFDPEIAPLFESYKTDYRAWKTLVKDLAERTARRRELAQEADRLQFAIDEINTIDPYSGEEIELVDTIRTLQDVDGLREQALSALTAIDGGEADSAFDDEGASSLLGKAQSVLGSGDNQQFQKWAEAIGEMTSQLTEIAAGLGSFLSELPSDPEALEKALVRQQQLKSLTRKYAPTIEEVVEWRDKAERKLATIDTSPEALHELKEQVTKAEKAMRESGARLSRARKKAGEKLGKVVTEEIRGLAMPKARIEVAIEPCEPSPGGLETIELRLAQTTAVEALPLSQAASGGELSRVMLALEVILSSGSQGCTLVFDEVDAGVGGRAAVEIGRRLARLASRHQVIAVTHLPQVAAYADTHLHVAKDVTDESVTSGVDDLQGDRRVEELARMLAGLDDTASGRAHAQELLDRAHSEVSAFRAPSPQKGRAAQQ